MAWVVVQVFAWKHHVLGRWGLYCNSFGTNGIHHLLVLVLDVVIGMKCSGSGGPELGCGLFHWVSLVLVC